MIFTCLHVLEIYASLTTVAHAADPSSPFLLRSDWLLLCLIVTHAVASSVAIVLLAVGTLGRDLLAALAGKLIFWEKECVTLTAVDAGFAGFSSLRVWRHVAVGCYSVATLAIASDRHRIAAARACSHGPRGRGLATGSQNNGDNDDWENTYHNLTLTFRPRLGP